MKIRWKQIKLGEKTINICHRKDEMKALCAETSRLYPDRIELMYFGDMDDLIKSEHFKDITKHWNTADDLYFTLIRVYHMKQLDLNIVSAFYIPHTGRL